MDWYENPKGTRCKNGYKNNKKTKRCVRSAPSTVYKSAVPSPVSNPAPAAIHQKIQVPRVGSKCPKSFTYNKSSKMCEKCPDGTRKVGQKCILEPTNDVPALKEPTTVVLPKPDNAPGNSLKELLDKLEKSGKQIKDPKYKSATILSFVYIYLIKKYASPCLLTNDDNTSIYYNTDKNKIMYGYNLGKSMRECIERGTDIIFMPLYIYNKSGSHVNLLIYRPFKKVIERYEPHGQRSELSFKNYNENKANAKLRELFEKTIRPELKEYTPVFKTPLEICPTKSNGFQGIENLLPSNPNESGYCQMWSMFMMETILLNPTLNTQDIIEQCIHIGKEDPTYFKNVIRGYTQQIAKEMKLYIGKYINYGDNIGTPNSNQIFDTTNISILFEETLAEVSKLKKPMPKIKF